jgi:short-subunit dehydrogenase
MWRTALVTGASSGLGEGFARELAARGCGLVLVARRAELLKGLAAEFGDRYGLTAEVLPADLTDQHQLHQVEERLADPARPVDLLVNSAGMGTHHRFTEQSAGFEEETVRLNVLAVTRLCHAALTGMCERRRGAVINVSSFAGLLPAFASSSTYGASKAFVYSLSEGLAIEASRYGVSVTVVCPGYVHTDRTAATSGVPGFAWTDRGTVIRETLRAAQAGKPLVIPGLPYKTVNALLRSLPRAVTRAAARRAPG